MRGICGGDAAAGIGLAGAGGVSATPINGLAIGQAADATNQVETVQHWRWGSGYRRGRRVAAAGAAAASAVATPGTRAASGGADPGRRIRSRRAGRTSGRLSCVFHRYVNTAMQY